MEHHIKNTVNKQITDGSGGGQGIGGQGIGGGGGGQGGGGQGIGGQGGGGQGADQGQNIILNVINIVDDEDSPKLNTRNESRIEQSFRLQGVNVVDIMTKIINNDLMDLDIPDQKYIYNSKKLALSRTYGSYPHDTFYEIKIGGRKDKIVTLTSTCKSGTKFCDWCRRDFNWDAIGIPICMINEEKSNIITFNVVGEHCTFECMYADASSYILKSPRMTSSIYADSDTLINVMFNLIHEDKELRVAPYWKLYNGGKGSLTTEEFFSNTHKYIPNGSVNIHPVRPEYCKKIL